MDRVDKNYGKGGNRRKWERGSKKMNMEKRKRNDEIDLREEKQCRERRSSERKGKKVWKEDEITLHLYYTRSVFRASSQLRATTAHHRPSLSDIATLADTTLRDTVRNTTVAVRNRPSVIQDEEQAQVCTSRSLSCCRGQVIGNFSSLCVEQVSLLTGVELLPKHDCKKQRGCKEGQDNRRTEKRTGK